VRIALVSPYDLAVPGGVQSHVAHLAAALRVVGDEVVVVGPGEDGESGEDRQDGESGEDRGDRGAGGHGGGGRGYRSVGGSVKVPFNGSVAPIGLSPWTARRTVSVLRELAPDVIHVHEPLVPWAGLASLRCGNAPVVGTFHAWSDRARAYKLARPLGRAVLGRLAAAVAVSDAAAAYHGGALGVPKARFRIVPNGVEVARFASAEPFEDLRADERPTLLFVGRLEKRKGLEPLVRAFTLLKAERPDLRLLVVGDGPERARCQGLLPARLRSDVTFLGRVAQEDLPRYYATCDLYVSPALGGESFGIVLLEAMAAGAPIVASDLPGYRSVARDELQGRLVPPGDPQALADAIRALLDNASLRGAMAAEGKRTVQAYDWAVVADRLRDLYLDVA
jgi:phosphatidyl-myo-inositol alpha-mannosyltransferase